MVKPSFSFFDAFQLRSSPPDKQPRPRTSSEAFRSKLAAVELMLSLLLIQSFMLFDAATANCICDPPDQGIAPDSSLTPDLPADQTYQIGANTFNWPIPLQVQTDGCSHEDSLVISSPDPIPVWLRLLDSSRTLQIHTTDTAFESVSEQVISIQNQLRDANGNLCAFGENTFKVSLTNLCVVTAWEAVAQPISETIVYLDAYQAVPLFTSFVQVPACGYDFTFASQSYSFLTNDDTSSQELINIDWVTNSFTMDVAKTNVDLSPFRLSVNHQLSVSTNPLNPTIFDTITVVYELTVTDPCTTATIDPIVFNPTSITVMDEYAESAVFSEPLNSVSQTYSGTDLCGTKTYTVQDSATEYLVITDTGDGTKTITADPTFYSSDKSTEATEVFTVKTSFQDYPSIERETTISVTFKPSVCDCSTLKWDSPIDDIFANRFNSAGLVPVGQETWLNFYQLIPDTSAQSENPAFNYCYDAANTPCDTTGSFTGIFQLWNHDQTIEYPNDWVLFEAPQKVYIMPPDISETDIYTIIATFEPVNGGTQQGLVRGFKVCDCDPRTLTEPSITSVTVQVSSDGTLDQEQTIPSAIFSNGGSGDSNFNICFDAGWCTAIESFTFEQIANDDGTNVQTTKPDWIEFTQSNTALKFSPRSGSENGTYLIKLKQNLYDGASLEFTAFTLTVTCQVVSITRPATATDPIQILSGLDYHQFVLAKETTYDLLVTGYIQVPDCQYDLTNNWSWTITNQDQDNSSSSQISAFNFADGQEASDAILKVHAIDKADAGIYTIMLTNDISIGSNGPVADSQFNSSESEKFIFNDFEIKDACELTDVLVYDSASTIKKTADSEVTEEGEFDLLTNLFFKFDSNHSDHFDTSVSYDILGDGAPICGPMTHEISVVSPQPENEWLVSDTLSNGRISVKPLDPPTLARVTLTLTTWTQEMSTDPVPIYDQEFQVQFMLGDCDRVLTENLISQYEKQCFVDDTAEVDIETQIFKFGSLTNPLNNNCGGDYIQTISVPDGSGLSIENTWSKILCSDVEHVPYLYSDIVIEANWVIGDSADVVTKTISIGVRTKRKTVEIVTELLDIQAYTGMQNESQVTIIDQFSFLQLDYYKIEFYFIRKADFETNSCSQKENWNSCFQIETESISSYGSTNSFFSAQFIANDIEVTVFQDLTDRSVITEWYLVALVQNLDEDVVIQETYESAKAYRFLVQDPCKSSPPSVEVESFTPWNIEEDEVTEDQTMMYLLKSLKLKFTNDALFDTTISYEQMQADSIQICGTFVSSEFITTPSDTSSAVTLTHHQNSRITIEGITKTIAVRMQFKLSDSDMTVVFSESYDSTLMIGNCIRTLNHNQSKYEWSGQVSKVVRELEPTLIIPRDIFIFDSCSELSKYNQVLSIAPDDEALTIKGISMQDEESTIKIIEDSGMYSSVNYDAADPKTLITARTATVTVQATWNIFERQIAQRNHGFQLQILTLWTGEDLSLQLTDTNLQMKQADSEDKILTFDQEDFTATYKFKRSQVAFTPLPYELVEFEGTDGIFETKYDYSLGENYEEERHKGILYTDNDDGNKDKILNQCQGWNRLIERTTINKEIEVLNDIDDSIISDPLVNFYCEYLPCSNFDYDGELVHGQTIQVQEQYFVHYDTQTFDLPVIDSFCYMERVQKYFSSALQYSENQGGDLVIFEDSEELAEYGIYIISQNMTAMVQFYSIDEQLWDSKFTIIINSTLIEEPEWSNTNVVTLSFLRAPCHVTQDFVDNTIASLVGIEITAMQNFKEEFDLSIYMQTIDIAFWTGSTGSSENTLLFCGTLIREIVDPDDETPFVKLSVTKQNELSVRPAWDQEKQTYNSAKLFFYLSEFPEINASIPISVEVIECKVLAVRFSSNIKEVTQIIGEAGTEIELPQIIYSPNCGYDPVIKSYSSVTDYAPKEFDTKNLYSINRTTKIIQIKYQYQLTLEGASMQETIQFVVENQQIDLVLKINYKTNGPTFEQGTPSLQGICCCSEDENWKFKIPVFKLASQQSIQVNFIQDTEFSKLFLLSGNSLVINPAYKEALSEGQICPSQEIFTLRLDAVSDKLGTSTFSLEGANKKSSASAASNEQNFSYSEFVFDFEQNIEVTLEEANSEDFVQPNVSIQSISNKGEVVIQFSDSMIVPSDFTPFQATRTSPQDQTTEQNNLDIQVISEEDDLESRNLKFDWTIASFTKNKMKIQLTFENPFDVSEGADPDTLQIIFYETSYLTRAYDGALIAENTKLSQDLPKIFGQTNDGFENTTKLVGNSGKGSMLIMVIVNYFMQFYLNTVLSMIRTISMLVHLMAINLNTPETMEIFFSMLFELVSFDMIPTDFIYEAWFAFENLPISEKFDAVGYSSQYIIWNLGSIFLFLLAEIFFQLMYVIIGLIAPANSRAEQWAKNRTASFLWAGLISFYHEVYICMSFSAIINLFELKLEGQKTSVLINNIFALSMAVTLVLGPVFIVLGLRQSWRASDEQIEKVYLKISAKFNNEAIKQQNFRKTLTNVSSTIDQSLSVLTIDHLTSITQTGLMRKARKEEIKRKDQSSESSQMVLGEQQSQSSTILSQQIKTKKSSQPALLGIYQPNINKFKKHNDLEISSDESEESGEQMKNLPVSTSQENDNQDQQQQQQSNRTPEEFKRMVSDLKRLEQHDQELNQQAKEQFLPYLEGGESEIPQSNGANLLEVIAAQRARERQEKIMAAREAVRLEAHRQESMKSLVGKENVTEPEKVKVDQPAKKVADDSSIKACLMKARFEKERIDEYDWGVAQNFGPLIEQFPTRVILNRKMAYIYVGVNFYRRLSLPMVIILVQTSPALSIIIVLQINLYYNAFVLGNNFYNDRGTLVRETSSEILVIFTIYFLMCFVEQYIAEIEMRNYLGQLVMSLACLILVVNLMPFIILMLDKVKKKICLRIYGRCCKKHQQNTALRKKNKRRKNLSQMEQLELSSEPESQPDEEQSDSQNEYNKENNGPEKQNQTKKSIEKRIRRQKKMSPTLKTLTIDDWCSNTSKSLVKVLKEKEAKLSLAIARFNHESSKCDYNQFTVLTESKIKCDKDFQTQLMLVAKFIEIMQLPNSRQLSTDWTDRDQQLYDFGIEQKIDLPEVLIFNYELNRDLLLIERHIEEERESEQNGNKGSPTTKMIDTTDGGSAYKESDTSCIAIQRRNHSPR